MKKSIFLLFITFGLVQFTNAQCTVTSSGFGNNTNVPMYNVQGSVEVVLNNNNTVTINLKSDFSTAAGPDVRIFLVDRGTLTTSQLRITSNFLARPRFEIGLSAASGAQSFTKTIPSGITITDFETVYFYCQAFNQFWDFGSFTPFASNNCSVLGTEDFENNNLILYPNPVETQLNIQLEINKLSSKVAIYNSLGVLTYESFYDLSKPNQFIDCSSLQSGVYFVEITDEENKVYRKKNTKKVRF